MKAFPECKFVSFRVAWHGRMLTMHVLSPQAVQAGELIRTCLWICVVLCRCVDSQRLQGLRAWHGGTETVAWIPQ